MRQFILGFLLTACLSSVCLGETATALTDEKTVVRLGRNVAILEDPGATLHIGQVSSPEYAAGFRPNGETTPNLGYTRSAVWVRFTVKNLTFSDPWVLQAAFPDMDNVELYAEEDSNWLVRELGQALPFTSRRIVNRKLLFELSLPFGQERTFYLRYQNGAGMTLPLALYSSQQYQTRALEEQLLFGIFFGFMLVLSLYNLILYVKIRESGYLHGFLYITAYGLFQFSLYGLAHQYLWPGWTRWASHIVPMFLASAFFCRILFTMSVLNSGVNAPRWHRLLQGLLAVTVLLAAYRGAYALGLLPAGWGVGPRATLGGMALYFAAFTVAVFAINVRCLGRKVPAARPFLVAWIFMVSGLILYGLKCLGFLPANFLTEYGMLFGSVGEMCLLFFSLGESIQAIKSEAQEKHLRQQAAIHAFQEEQIRSMRLELELIKANIQPHFMLNSLNAATMWIREDPGTAEKLLHALSRELKQLLRIVGEKVIPIGEEIRMCRAHLEVMSLRHDKSFTMRLEGIRADEMIPPMVFHTLVENGLTHGYAGKDEGEFLLTRREDEGSVYFTLRNDGDTAKKAVESGGLGLKYVRARLEEVYGGKWRLDSRPDPGGWVVTIAIRKETERLYPMEAARCGF